MSSSNHEQQSDHEWVSIQKELNRLKGERRRELRLAVVAIAAPLIAEILRKVLEHWF